MSFFQNVGDYRVDFVLGVHIYLNVDDRHHPFSEAVLSTLRPSFTTRRQPSSEHQNHTHSLSTIS
jgi:hypothetical protein